MYMQPKKTFFFTNPFRVSCEKHACAHAVHYLALCCYRVAAVLFVSRARLIRRIASRTKANRVQCSEKTLCAHAVKVHIIEAADLKGLDASGTSDPIVYVDCLGLKKHTRVRKGVTSAVFDEVLYFTLPKLSR